MNKSELLFTLGHLNTIVARKDFAQKHTFLLYSIQNSYNFWEVRICLVAHFFSLFRAENMFKFLKMRQFIWRSEIREMHSLLFFIWSIFNEIRSKHKISQFLPNFQFLHLASWREKNGENWWKKSQKCHFFHSCSELSLTNSNTKKSNAYGYF